MMSSRAFSQMHAPPYDHQKQLCTYDHQKQLCPYRGMHVCTSNQENERAEDKERRAKERAAEKERNDSLRQRAPLPNNTNGVGIKWPISYRPTTGGRNLWKQPCCQTHTCPRTFSAGTAQFSNMSSHVSLPRMPSLSIFCAVEKPCKPHTPNHLSAYWS